MLRNAPVTKLTQDAGQDQNMDKSTHEGTCRNTIYENNRIARLSGIRARRKRESLTKSAGQKQRGERLLQATMGRIIADSRDIPIRSSIMGGKYPMAGISEQALQRPRPSEEKKQSMASDTNGNNPKHAEMPLS